MLEQETDLGSFNGNLIKIVSPSLIDMDNKESKGWGTLLHVMNRKQTDWVSFLKELIEFVLSSSNHLIGIGPKLDGNTLYIKGLSWEWTAIFCLN